MECPEVPHLVYWMEGATPPIKGVIKPLPTQMTNPNGSIPTWVGCKEWEPLPHSISQFSLVKLQACHSPNILATPPINTQLRLHIPHYCLYLKVPHLLLCYTLRRQVQASPLVGGAEVKVGVAKIRPGRNIKEPDPRVLGTHL